MATNVSYASGDTTLETLILHTLPYFGPKAGDGIINQNALLSVIKDKKYGYRECDGGQEIWEDVMVNKNSNSQWQDKHTDMKTQYQDPDARLRWDWKVFTSSIVKNALDEAKNKGRSAIKSLAKKYTMQAESSIPNEFNSALWAATPASNAPDSVPYLITTTPTTGTIGGATRSAKSALQNIAYTTSISDIGSEAGLAKLYNYIAITAINKNDRPDILVMGDDLYSGLAAYLETARRYTPANKEANTMWDGIMVNGTTIVMEALTNIDTTEWNTITSKYVYGINSKHFFFNLLKDMAWKWESKFERIGTSMNYALYFNSSCQLSTDLPKAHFVLSNVSTT